jgi:hypothetical protein
MTSPKLVPCLVLLRATFDDLWPGRSHASDGWIGDAAHAARKSKHNPDKRGMVHAIDVTKFDGIHQVVVHLAQRCRDGLEKRLTAIIWHGTIWTPESGWEGVDYDGPDPHTEHAHFSASDTPALENSQKSWYLEETPMDLTPAAVEDVADAVIRKMRTAREGAISIVDEQQIARAVVGSDAFKALSNQVAEALQALDAFMANKPATPAKTPGK